MSAASRVRPVFWRPGVLGLVLVGGALGTAGRALLAGAFPAGAGDWPGTTFAINVAGSFVLAVLVTLSLRRGPDEGRLRLVRITLGTGILGGFTTYSTFIVEVDRLLRDGFVATAVAYAVGSVVLGIAAAFTGVVVARGRA